MTECEFCGTPVTGGSAFTCSYCGGTFCPSHRLPFNHACPRIEDWKHARPEKIQMGRERKKKTVYRVDQKTLVAAVVILVLFIVLVVWVMSGW